MFTPLSKGSERTQHRLWDHTISPRRAPDASRNKPTHSHPVTPSRRVTITHARGESRERADEWQSWVLRPKRAAVEHWLGTWWRRHIVLVLVPCLIVWVWVAIPFPVSNPYVDDPFPDIPQWPRKGKHQEDDIPKADETKPLPVDVNFYFFLFWYFGMYLAVALLFITSCFSLYRLNWWPSRLGGKISYAATWATTLLVGLAAHQLDLFSLRERWRAHDPNSDVDWERKTFWVSLSFCAMLMPAVACFSKLKKDKRHLYRHSLPDISKTFFERNFSRRIPSSWLRFLWFMACLAIASFALMAGQAYASLFLTTLPHTSLDAGTWVYSWILSAVELLVGLANALAVQLLAQISFFILGSKVRSRALLFLYKLFFQLVYHVFYRNLFARLRSPSQFAVVQTLSSISVVFIFPLQMTRAWHRILQIVIGYPSPWEDHADSVAIGFYCRSLAQNVTMVGFLGWLSILHFGPNQQIYPFFRLTPGPEDPYTFQLTFLASCAIWASELLSSYIARKVMWFSFKIDVTQVGLTEMREYPELVPACVWASVHVSMNILLFLIQLNFR